MTKSPISNDDPEIYEESQNSKSETPNLDGDWVNFFVLLILFIIQGISVGLCTAFPMILQSKGMVTYDDQAIFSTAVWPFTIKIFWAPLVDALFVQRIGRRKSWLLPLQLLMGLCYIYLANNVDAWLPESGKPNLKMLVFVIFVINFLSATQDIVVDGWSLTILEKKNVCYSSACNSVGVPLGVFLGSVCFTLLVSDKFSNTYLGTKPNTGGIVSMKNFLLFCGIAILCTTLLIGLFKKEKDHRLETGYIMINVYQSYELLWKILKQRRIRVLGIALLTAQVGFLATDSISNFKLIDAGVSKDDIMITTTVMYAVKFIMPIFVTKCITSTKPMSYYLKVTPIRLLWTIAYIVLIGNTQNLIHTNEVVNISIYYYILLGFVFLINEILGFFMLLALMAFFCRISDPHFGGMYMTVFNTFYYLGYLVSNTVFLKLVNEFTFNICSNNAHNNCSTENLKNSCNINGGICEIYVDGYYIITAICMTIGFVWYFSFRNVIKTYQSLNLSHWTINVKKLNTQEVNLPCINSP